LASAPTGPPNFSHLLFIRARVILGIVIFVLLVVLVAFDVNENE